MSMAIAHFAFGAAMTTLLVTLFFSDEPSPLSAISNVDARDRLPTIPYPQTVSLLGGVWAMLPDVQRITPVGRSWLFDFHKSHWADLFWFHRTMDVLDPGDSELAAILAVLFFIGTTAFAEWWESKAPGIVDDRIESTSEDEAKPKQRQ